MSDDRTLSERLANLELLFANEAYDEIRNAIRSLRGENPGSLPELDVWESRIDWNQGRRDEAIAGLERLFARDPADQAVASELVAALEALGRNDDARERERAHLDAYFGSADPGPALERLQVSLAAANSALIRRGLEALRGRVPENDRPARESFRLLETRLAAIEDPRAYPAMLEETLREFPDSRLGLVLRFELLRERKDPAGAEAAILRLLNGRPDDGAALVLYANLMLENFQPAKARALAERALVLQPASTPARLVLIGALLVLDEDDLASREAQNLIDFDPHRREAWIGVLSVLESQRRYDKAARITRWLRERLPDDPELKRIDLEFRVRAHPSMKFVAPFRRYGMAAPVVVYFVFVATAALARRYLSDGAAAVVLLVFLVWILSTWFWPPLLRRILRARE